MSTEATTVNWTDITGSEAHRRMALCRVMGRDVSDDEWRAFERRRAPAPESDPVADDPLTVALLDASDDCHDDASGQSARDDLAARAARLSAVLAAAREVADEALHDEQGPSIRARTLIDALAAADGAR